MRHTHKEHKAFVHTNTAPSTHTNLKLDRYKTHPVFFVAFFSKLCYISLFIRWVHATTYKCGGQRAGLRSWFSHFPTRALEIEPGSSGVAASAWPQSPLVGSHLYSSPTRGALLISIATNSTHSPSPTQPLLPLPPHLRLLRTLVWKASLQETISKTLKCLPLNRAGANKNAYHLSRKVLGICVLINWALQTL